MDKLKKALTGRDNEGDEEKGFVAQAIDASSLSWGTRVQGFCACFVIGAVVALLGAIVLALGGSIKTFGVLYTLGNISAISSTCFLVGPMAQLEKMFAKTRVIATTVMIVSLALTLCSVFWWNKKILALTFTVIQFLAMTWYSISYIPYARDAIVTCFNKIIA
eukprot:TRINITY_DN6186_c0_g2_i1.p1 TRINITY_DN6186_c0_g2~~TRINITY_DN6186_c0_g2_i1.p1  ORF type:complete len:163 (-),score=7.85 TRINITY_DN6186_c0_g2_i1:433-921(-)